MSGYQPGDGSDFEYYPEQLGPHSESHHSLFYFPVVKAENEFTGLNRSWGFFIFGLLISPGAPRHEQGDGASHSRVQGVNFAAHGQLEQ